MSSPVGLWLSAHTRTHTHKTNAIERTLMGAIILKHTLFHSRRVRTILSRYIVPVSAATPLPTELTDGLHGRGIDLQEETLVAVRDSIIINHHHCRHCHHHHHYHCDHHCRRCLLPSPSPSPSLMSFVSPLSFCFLCYHAPYPTVKSRSL